MTNPGEKLPRLMEITA